MTIESSGLASQKLFVSREEYVYDTIRGYVVSGQLKPQQEINQAELARQLGVSIIPVRSAISRLAAEGFLTSQGHYHSIQVFSLTKPELEELLIIGTGLELLATRQAVPNIPAEGAEEIRRLLEEMDGTVHDSQLLQFGILNRKFHMSIYRHSHMPRLLQMIQDIWDKADIYNFRAMFTLLPDLAGHAQQEHAEIFRLITAGDLEQAQALMERHKAYSRRAFLLTFDSLADALPSSSEGAG